MEDCKKWIGQKFIDFCRSDPEDDREIHYFLRAGDVSTTLEFSSQQMVSPKVMNQIRRSVITDIYLSDNWWHVCLVCKEEKEMQEKTVSTAKTVEEEKEEFKQICAEVMPHLAIVAEKLKEHDLERSVSVYLKPDGYISFKIHDSDRSLECYKLGSEKNPVIEYTYREKLE